MTSDYKIFKQNSSKESILKEKNDKINPESAAPSTMYWQQELIQKDESLAKLIYDQSPAKNGMDQNKFDAATFLYDLYKTCTVREIDQFKVLLQEVQQEILQRDLKRNITDRVNKEDGQFESQENIILMCDHLIRANDILQS